MGFYDQTSTLPFYQNAGTLGFFGSAPQQEGPTSGLYLNNPWLPSAAPSSPPYATTGQVLNTLGVPVPLPGEQTPEELMNLIEASMVKLETANPDLAAQYRERYMGEQDEGGLLGFLGDIGGALVEGAGAVLDLIGRTSHIIPAMFVEDKDPWYRDIGQALTGQDRSTWSDVFADWGWEGGGISGALRAGVGFIGDVLTDPLTYAFGAGGLAGTAEKAATAGKAGITAVLAKDAAALGLKSADDLASVTERLWNAFSGNADHLGNLMRGLSPEEQGIMLAGMVGREIESGASVLMADAWHLANEGYAKVYGRTMSRWLKGKGPEVLLPSGRIADPSDVRAVLNSYVKAGQMASPRTARAAVGMAKAAAGVMGGLRFTPLIPWTHFRYMTPTLPFTMGTLNRPILSVARFASGKSLMVRAEQAAKVLGPDSLNALSIAREGGLKALRRSTDPNARLMYDYLTVDNGAIRSAFYRASERTGGLTAAITPGARMYRMGLGYYFKESYRKAAAKNLANLITNDMYGAVPVGTSAARAEVGAGQQKLYAEMEQNLGVSNRVRFDLADNQMKLNFSEFLHAFGGLDAPISAKEVEDGTFDTWFWSRWDVKDELAAAKSAGEETLATVRDELERYNRQLKLLLKAVPEGPARNTLIHEAATHARGNDLMQSYGVASRDVSLGQLETQRNILPEDAELIESTSATRGMVLYANLQDPTGATSGDIVGHGEVGVGGILLSTQPEEGWVPVAVRAFNPLVLGEGAGSEVTLATQRLLSNEPIIAKLRAEAEAKLRSEAQALVDAGHDILPGAAVSPEKWDDTVSLMVADALKSQPGLPYDHIVLRGGADGPTRVVLIGNREMHPQDMLWVKSETAAPLGRTQGYFPLSLNRSVQEDITGAYGATRRIVRKIPEVEALLRRHSKGRTLTEIDMQWRTKLVEIMRADGIDEEHVKRYLSRSPSGDYTIQVLEIDPLKAHEQYVKRVSQSIWASLMGTQGQRLDVLGRLLPAQFGRVVRMDQVRMVTDASAWKQVRKSSAKVRRGAEKMLRKEARYLDSRIKDNEAEAERIAELLRRWEMGEDVDLTDIDALNPHTQRLLRETTNFEGALRQERERLQKEMELWQAREQDTAAVERALKDSPARLVTRPHDLVDPKQHFTWDDIPSPSVAKAPQQEAGEETGIIEVYHGGGKAYVEPTTGRKSGEDVAAKHGGAGGDIVGREHYVTTSPKVSSGYASATQNKDVEDVVSAWYFEMWNPERGEAEFYDSLNVGGTDDWVTEIGDDPSRDGTVVFTLEQTLKKYMGEDFEFPETVEVRYGSEREIGVPPEEARDVPFIDVFDEPTGIHVRMLFNRTVFMGPEAKDKYLVRGWSVADAVIFPQPAPNVRMGVLRLPKDSVFFAHRKLDQETVDRVSNGIMAYQAANPDFNPGIAKELSRYIRSILRQQELVEEMGKAGAALKPAFPELEGKEIWDAMASRLGDDLTNDILEFMGYEAIHYNGGSLMGGGYNHEAFAVFNPEKSIVHMGNVQKLAAAEGRATPEQLEDMLLRNEVGIHANGTILTREGRLRTPGTGGVRRVYSREEVDRSLLRARARRLDLERLAKNPYAEPGKGRYPDESEFEFIDRIILEKTVTFNRDGADLAPLSISAGNDRTYKRFALHLERFKKSGEARYLGENVWFIPSQVADAPGGAYLALDKKGTIVGIREVDDAGAAIAMTAPNAQQQGIGYRLLKAHWQDQGVTDLAGVQRMVESNTYSELGAKLNRRAARRYLSEVLGAEPSGAGGITSRQTVAEEAAAQEDFARRMLSEAGARKPRRPSVAVATENVQKARKALGVEVTREVKRAEDRAKALAARHSRLGRDLQDALASLNDMNDVYNNSLAKLRPAVVVGGQSGDHEFMQQVAVPGLQGMWWHTYIAQELEGQLLGKPVSHFRNQWREFVLNPWKKWATYRNPGFNVRNAMGAWFNNFLGGVQTQNYHLSFRVMNARDGGVWATRRMDTKTFDALGLKNIPGVAELRGHMTYGNLADMLTDVGITRGSAAAVDLVKGGAREYQRFRSRAAVPGRWADQHLRRFSSTVEDYFRVAAWASGMEQLGGDLYGARAFVMMRHGDYTDLTDSEDFIRDILPFYKWMRTNIPYQLRMLATNPGYMVGVGKAQSAIYEASGLDPEEYMKSTPDWMKGALAIPLPGAKDGDPVNILALDLPFMDLYRGTREYLSSFLPGVLPIIESFGIGKVLYSGRELTGEMVPLSGWAQLPGIKQVMAALPGAQMGPDGQVYVPDKYENVLSAVPVYSRFRNWLTGDPNRVEKRWGALSSWMFGIPVRNIDLTDDEKTFYYDVLEPTLNAYRSMGVVFPTKDELVEAGLLFETDTLDLSTLYPDGVIGSVAA